METPGINLLHVSADAEGFVHGLLESAAGERLPELFKTPHPNALYHMANRNGVSTVVLRTRELREDQLVQLMKYRLAQYLAVNFVNAQMIFEAGLEHEPLSSVSPEDVHVIAGSAETGRLLCYATLEARRPANARTTLRMRDRPLFPVERIHGWGIYNRLRVLPDLPAAKLLELGRFVKNQRLPVGDELGVRGPVEVAVALFRTLSGPLRLEVEAIIGDLEEGVALQNLAFFHVPMVVIHGTVPYEAETSYFFPRYQNCTVYPFAALASDISSAMLARLDAVERALAHPGRQGLAALFALKRDLQVPISSLEPPEGLAPLTAVMLPQREVAMQSRRHMLDVGECLRAMSLFRNLSVAEAAILGTLIERRTYAAGEIIVRRGQVGDALFLIEAGRAEIRMRGWTRSPVTVASLGPDDFFGELALATGTEIISDVVAVTPVTLLRLTKDDYARYLLPTPDIEREIVRTAAARAAEAVLCISEGAA